MPKRIREIDALKGLAITLVVLGHVIAFSNLETYSSSYLFNIIYTFHMPLFMALSGFLVYGRFGPDVKTWLTKKTNALIIPYVVFTLVYFFVLPGFSPTSITPERLVQALLAFTIPDSAWFLPILFICLCLLGPLYYLDKHIGFWTYIAFFALFIFILPLTPLSSQKGISLVIWYAPFVVSGYLAAKIITYDRWDLPVHHIIIVGLIGFPIAILLKFAHIDQRILGTDIFGIANTMWPTGCNYLIAFLGILFSYAIISIIYKSELGKSRAFSFVMLLGVFSMEIYLVHLILLFYSSFLQVPLWFGTSGIEYISGTIIIIMLSLALAFIISYNKTISKLFFGRWSIRNLPSTVLCRIGIQP